MRICHCLRTIIFTTKKDINSIHSLPIYKWLNCVFHRYNNITFPNCYRILRVQDYFHNKKARMQQVNRCLTVYSAQRITRVFKIKGTQNIEYWTGPTEMVFFVDDSL